MIQAISFRGDRSPVPPRVKIGFESDNLVESLAFELPDISGDQSAMLMINGNAYANMIDLYRTEDGKWAVALTAEMVGPAGVYESYVAIACPDGRRWNSGVFDLLTGDLPDVSESVEALYPTAVEHVLQEMAETRQEMAASVTATEDAAQRAEDAAQRAENAANQGGGGEAPAKDAVLYTAQTLTEEQQAQARDNISAASAEAVDKLSEEKLDKSRFEAVVEGGVPSVNLYAPQTEGWMDNATIVTGGYPEVHSQYRVKYCVTPAIPVEGGKTYTVSPAPLPAGVMEAKNRIGVYDASGTTLGVLVITDNADGSMTFTVPTTAKSIMLTAQKALFDSNSVFSTVIANFNSTVMLVEGTTAPDEYVPYVPDGSRLKNIALPAKSVILDAIGDDAKPVISPLLGKKIANFGDSVFGNARPPLDVSTFLADNTGATVYNCAFGGCRMSQHVGHWDAFSMYRLAYAIANNDYSLQDEAINHDDRTSYAEEPLALMKTVDYSGLDILTISYGTNDFTGNNAIDNADNPLDTTTVCGALRYSIETLLTAYPNLRIFVLLPTYRFWIDSANAYTDDAFNHTNNLGKTLVEYNEAIAETAKAYNIPVIDNFAELGINKLNRQQYFPVTDGTHHNENGRKLIAKHLAHNLW